MALAAILLGSNLHDRAGYLASAIKLLPAAPLQILKVSNLYETEPVECSWQPWYLNQVVLIETSLRAPMLLEFVLGLEKRLGRRRSRPLGSRTLDADILFVDNLIHQTPGLAIPHPALSRRRCALAPLCDVAPGWRHPLLGLTAAELLDRCLDPRRVTGVQIDRDSV